MARLETLSTVERSYTDLKRENGRLRGEGAFWMPAASGRPAKKAVRAVYDA